MGTIITHGTDTIRPDAVTEYVSSRTRPNRVRRVLDRQSPDVTLRPAGLRTGTLKLTFTGASTAPTSTLIVVDGIVRAIDMPGTAGAEAASKHAEDLHSTGGVFTLLNSDLSTIGMRYVIAEDGQITRELSEGRKFWTVTVAFQEVAP